MNKIELVNLTCVRGGIELFTNLSACVEAGQVMRLTGPNGCGKSSLLKIITGRLEASQGTVHHNGKPLNCQDVMFLDHKPVVKSVLSVQENLEFWARLYDTKSKLPLAYKAFGLEPLLYTNAGMLSSGQKKRVQLALLLLKSAKLWLLDEPLLSLDSKYVDRLGEIIQSHVGAGGMVIYASHEPVPNISETILDVSAYVNRQRHDLAHAA